MILDTNFYAQGAQAVAQALLGKYLVHEAPSGTLVGKIVETEAYLVNDPANHAYRGETKRNAVMFGPPGRAYIYFIYGKHYCFNIVCGRVGLAEAVLIRALEPVAGIDTMQHHRQTTDSRQLANGPAKLVTAMGLSMEYNGTRVTEPPLYVTTEIADTPAAQGGMEIEATPCIGIRFGADLPLRYTIKGNAYASR